MVPAMRRRCRDLVGIDRKSLQKSRTTRGGEGRERKESAETRQQPAHQSAGLCRRSMLTGRKACTAIGKGRSVPQ